LKKVLKKEDHEKELLDQEGRPSSTNESISNGPKRGKQGSPGGSSRRKIKTKLPPSTDLVAQEPEEIRDSPVASTSTGSRSSGEKVKDLRRPTRARARSQKR